MAALITKNIGDDWITDLDKLQDLTPFSEDKKFRKEFAKIKHENKKRLAKYILEHEGIEIDPNTLFDIQIKRIHEYKRQLMAAITCDYLIQSH